MCCEEEEYIFYNVFSNCLINRIWLIFFSVQVCEPTNTSTSLCIIRTSDEEWYEYWGHMSYLLSWHLKPVHDWIMKHCPRWLGDTTGRFVSRVNNNFVIQSKTLFGSYSISLAAFFILKTTNFQLHVDFKLQHCQI